MKKNKIFIAIASRYPSLLPATLELINTNVSDRHNIEIVVVINRGDRDKYSAIQNKYGFRLEEAGFSLREAYLKLFEIFETTDDYFFWFLPDDMSAMSRDFDSAIITTYQHFIDDIFIISSFNTWNGRETRIVQSNYIIDKTFGGPYKTCVKNFENHYLGEMPFDFLVCYHYGDMFPAFSYRFVHFIKKFFENPKNLIGIDIISAYLIQQLSRSYNENRNIVAIPNGLLCVDQKSTDKLIKSYYFDLKVIVDILKEISINIGKDPNLVISPVLNVAPVVNPDPINRRVVIKGRSISISRERFRVNNRRKFRNS